MDKNAFPAEIQKKLLDKIKNNSRLDSNWTKIKDTHIASLIMNAYGDELNRKILKCTIHSPKTIMDILRECGSSHSTGYRKILGLIKNQFLTPYDTIRVTGGRTTTRYMATIRSLQIEINYSNDATVRVIFSHRISL